MEFDYFYHRDSERFSFYMHPKVLLSHEFYKNLSSDAKISIRAFWNDQICPLRTTGLMKKSEYTSSFRLRK